MFLGEYEHSVDQKNRVSVPKKFRLGLTGAVLTRGLEKCLFLYSGSGWEVLTRKLNSLPLTQRDARAFNRYLLSGAIEVEFDSLGRMVLPAYLREYAGVKTEVTVIGVGDRVEIWDKETWLKYRLATEKDSEDIAEKLNESGL